MAKGQFAYYLKRQILEIRERGWRALLRTGYIFMLLIPAVPVVLMIRALKPVVVVRFGPLISSRLGHFAANTENYLCQRDAGMHGYRVLDIFYHTSPICNQQLKKMWDRTLSVSRFAQPLDLVNRFLPGGASHMIPTLSERDIHNVLGRTRAHLCFTANEERLGHQALWEIGIPEGAPFVCFSTRDSAYLRNVFTKSGSSSHVFRDASIHNLVLAAEELTRRGYFAIRMGAVVEETLVTVNPMIIDYATKWRTDFLDIFLSAKCRFSIGANSGILLVPTIFRRPVASVNAVPLEHQPTWIPDDLFIPKKLWLKEEGRYMTFRETFESGAGTFLRGEQYEQLGIEPVENTPEEIMALAVEMDERLKATWQTTDEDEDLQRRFLALFRRSELHGTIVSRIGTEFLRQNQDLLE